MNKDIIDEKFYSTTANKYRREIYRINQRLNQIYKKVDKEGLKKLPIDQSIREEVVSLYFFGDFKLREFSNLFYVHNSTVRKWIIKYGDRYKKSNSQIKEQLNQKKETIEFEDYSSTTQNSKQSLSVEENEILAPDERKSFITIDVVKESVKKSSEELEKEFKELDYIDMSEKRVLVNNYRKSINNREFNEHCEKFISITYPNNTTIKIPKDMLCRELLRDMYLIHLPDI